MATFRRFLSSAVVDPWFLLVKPTEQELGGLLVCVPTSPDIIM